MQQNRPRVIGQEAALQKKTWGRRWVDNLEQVQQQTLKLEYTECRERPKELGLELRRIQGDLDPSQQLPDGREKRAAKLFLCRDSQWKKRQ